MTRDKSLEYGCADRDGIDPRVKSLRCAVTDCMSSDVSLSHLMFAIAHSEESGSAEDGPARLVSLLPKLMELGNAC